MAAFRGHRELWNLRLLGILHFKYHMYWAIQPCWGQKPILKPADQFQSIGYFSYLHIKNGFCGFEWLEKTQRIISHGTWKLCETQISIDQYLYWNIACPFIHMLSVVT